MAEYDPDNAVILALELILPEAVILVAGISVKPSPFPSNDPENEPLNIKFSCLTESAISALSACDADVGKFDVPNAETPGLSINLVLLAIMWCYYYKYCYFNLGFEVSPSMLFLLLPSGVVVGFA